MKTLATLRGPQITGLCWDCQEPIKGELGISRSTDKADPIIRFYICVDATKECHPIAAVHLSQIDLELSEAADEGPSQVN